MTQKQTVGNVGVNGDDNILNFVVGNDNTQNFFRYEITPYGGVVNILPPEQAPRITARQIPVRWLPRVYSDLLGRDAEIQKSVAALEASQTVELYGAAGVGKSVLLRYLAHHPPANSSRIFPDGIAYFHLFLQEPVEDLQQRLFDAFYESDRPFKPSAMRVRQDLQNRKALLILDNTSLSRQDIEKLWEVAPNCVFLFSSFERNLWGEGQPIQIGGVSQDAAILLMERELGRSLTSQERSAAEAICASLNGHPLEILQQISGVREGTEWLADVAGRLHKNPSPQARVKQLLDSLSKPQRLVLLALAALGGVALAAQQAAAIADVQEARTALNELQKKNLCSSTSEKGVEPHYSLSSNLLEPIQKQENLTPYLERAIPFFTRWVQQATPQELQNQSAAVSHLLRWAVDQGRWNDVLLLGKPFESALAVSGKWELQAQVLRWYEQAGERLGNKTAIAWANHQLGTRAFSLGYTSAAQNLLTKALRLREELGDQRGADLTRQLLNFRIPGPSSIPTPPTPPPTPPIDNPLLSFLQKAAIPAFVASLAGVSTVAVISALNPLPAPVPGQSPSPTPVPVQTSINDSPTPKPKQAVIPNCVNITASRLNVRSEPRGSSNSLALLESPGQATTTGQQQEGWLEISEPKQGWIAKSNTSPCAERSELAKVLPSLDVALSQTPTPTPTPRPQPTTVSPSIPVPNVASSQTPTPTPTPRPQPTTVSPSIPVPDPGIFRGVWQGRTDQGGVISFQVVPTNLGESVINLSVSFQFDASCPIGQVSFSSLDDSHIWSPGDSFRFLGLTQSNASASVEGAFTSRAVASGNLQVVDTRDPGARLNSQCPFQSVVGWRAEKQ
jgi:hypothetical protein